MSILARFLTIIDIALKATSNVVGGPIGAGLSIADALEQIALHAAQAYAAETGQPIDLTKVPPETKVS
jgi:hypothetical protein